MIREFDFAFGRVRLNVVIEFDPEVLGLGVLLCPTGVSFLLLPFALDLSWHVAPVRL